VLLATFNAVKSYESKRHISRSLSMEILLFVSGTRQISEAVKRVGINPETERTAALVVLPADADQAMVAEYLAGIFKEKGDDSLLDKWTTMRRSKVMKTFGIGDKELKAAMRDDGGIEKAIERLAIERSAMLAIAK
jgi:tRNA threonylcarbamoyladenosine modification (KEOPS) complex Cgi121 subunit